ncbi:trehalose-phosphatase [Luteimonas sp. 22616]|uniref:trehalose-phosphatase n=1 Tax=Luteimonas sp. 22616 TaxID=3453951 RepID=UPI003F874D9E
MQNNDLKEIGASGIDDVLLHDALPPPPPPADDWALFLDVDGCLLDLASTPDAVVVPDGLRERLEALQSRLDGALALVSGRTIATLDALFVPSRFNAVGLHGVEQRHAGVEFVAGEAPPELAGVRKAAARLAAVYDGTVVEDKGPALALHWRRAPDAEPALLAFAAHSLEQLPGYRLQHGKQVVELYPGSADDGERIDKGGAIAELLDTPPFQGRMPVFAGDDLTDESGFEVVNAHGGLSVLVGDRTPSVARHRLCDPAAVRAWLGVERGAG